MDTIPLLTKNQKIYKNQKLTKHQNLIKNQKIYIKNQNLTQKNQKFNKKSKMHQKRNWTPYHFLGTISNWFQNDANRNNVLYHLVMKRAPEIQY